MVTKAQQMMIEDGLPAEFVLPTAAERRADWKGVRVSKLATPAKAPEDPSTTQFRKELEAKAKAEERARKAARKEDRLIRARQKAALKPKTEQENDMAKKAAKKPASVKAFEKAKKIVAKKASAKAAPKAPAAAKPKKAPEAPAAGTRADGLREGSMQAKMLDMVLAPKGATEREICEELGWKKCRTTLNRVAEKVGATLAKSKEEGRDGTVYRASLPAKAA